MLLIPAALATLITVHLAMIMRQHHSQFPGPGRRERNVVGTPMWPAYALRSIGLLLAVAAVLFLVGGLVQINPIWQWGPYHPYLSENGAQPDWYIGWLIGALRLMPNFEPAIGSHTIIPNPFWGGAFFPLVVFGVMFAWPGLERRFTGDHRRHDLLDRPRDRPDPHRDRRGLPQLGRDHLRDRIHRPPVLPAAHLLQGPDPLLADRRVGAADHRLLHHPQRLPVACTQRGPPAAGVARSGGGSSARRELRCHLPATTIAPPLRPRSRRSAPCPGMTLPGRPSWLPAGSRPAHGLPTLRVAPMATARRVGDGYCAARRRVGERLGRCRCMAARLSRRTGQRARPGLGG